MHVTKINLHHMAIMDFWNFKSITAASDVVLDRGAIDRPSPVTHVVTVYLHWEFASCYYAADT
jgi:hypothetical protein